MTKEQARTHGEVIKWWIDNTDKCVWIKKDVGWMLYDEPTFHIEDVYVQNDEYAEFRKALVDGKQLQYKCWYPNQKTKWKDFTAVTATANFDVAIDYLRIKPDEPEFKVGDWVVDKSSGFTIRAYEGMIKKNFKKWEPVKGKWCVFWDDDTYEEYIIGRCSKDNSRLPEGYNNPFDNIAPLDFIQTLKN